MLVRSCRIDYEVDGAAAARQHNIPVGESLRLVYRLEYTRGTQASPPFWIIDGSNELDFMSQIVFLTQCQSRRSLLYEINKGHFTSTALPNRGLEPPPLGQANSYDREVCAPPLHCGLRYTKKLRGSDFISNIKKVYLRNF